MAIQIDPLIKKLAEAFLSWPLPASVCADHCTTYPITSDNPALQRIGTNLLSYAEAERMFTDIAGPVIAALRRDRATMETAHGEVVCALVQLRAENAALRDTFAILRDFIEGRRHDHENITKIINGAIRAKTP